MDTKEDEGDNDVKDDLVVLRLGCNCALGHHRSVAFVCELVRRDLPKDWLVEVEHRDLDKNRAGGARERQEAC